MKLESFWQLIALSLTCNTFTFAADIDFIGLSGTHWVTPANWENGTYPTLDDTAYLDATASLDTPSPNNIRAIKVGTQGSGTLHLTFDGSLNSAVVGTVSQIGSGSGHEGLVRQTNGSLSVNSLEIGSNSATGTYHLNRGTLTILRRSQNNSLYLGTNDNKTSDGLGSLLITAGSITTRGGVYLGSSNGGHGVFEVCGSDSAQIGIGSQNNIDGSWTQNSGSILRAKIDRTPRGITPILIDDAENDGVGGDVIFENGSLLEVDFLANFVNGGTFTVMEWEGSVTDNGLQFSPLVDTNVWSFQVDVANKRLTVTSVGAPYVREFIHPGSRHKRSDLERMREMVAAGVEPWASAFANFEASNQTRLNYTPANADSPLTTLTSTNKLRDEALLAYHNSLMWNITGDARYAEVSVAILNNWSYLTNITELTPLSIGQACCHLVEAAEIIKHTYPSWDPADIQKFSDMLVYPGYSNTIIPSGETTFYWQIRDGDPGRAGNQGLFSMRSMLAMGIFLDNERIYDRALRYMRGATNRTDDLAYPTGPPNLGSISASHEYAIQYNGAGRQTSIPDYGYNEVMANYIWENGQNEESSRDQVHGAVGLINISTACEQAWNQGDDLYGHLDNRLLLGWEFHIRYSLSNRRTFPDQLGPWEPSLETGEYLQRLVRSARRFPLKINPHIDGDENSFTRDHPAEEPVYAINLSHYRDRMGLSGDEIKWMERGEEFLRDLEGFEGLGTGSFSMTNWGGLKYHRTSPGDPVEGFSNGKPDFAMSLIPLTIEAENYDYFPTDGEGITYHDTSSTNSGLAFRPAEGVDLISASEGNFAISSIEAGEWITYTVSVPTTGDYDISIRYASSAPGGTIQFSFDGTDVSGNVAIPHGTPASTNASDWQSLVVATDAPLTQGVKQLTLTFGGTANAFLLNNITIEEPAILPIAHWRFDEGGSNIATDCSGNGYHGTINNATWTTRAGGGNALSFNGTNANVSLPASAFSSLNNEVTFAFWAFGDASLPAQNSAFWTGNSEGSRILNVHLPWDNSQVYFDASDRINKIATEAETEGTWVHWAFTKDANAGIMKIFRNGILWHSGTGKTNSIGTITEAFIGSQNNFRYYSGLIDDFRLYDVALSDTAIGDLHTASQNTTPEDHLWEGGESLNVNMTSPTGTAGSDWDLLNIACPLVLDDQLTPGNSFQVNLTASAIGFDNTTDQSWLIVTSPEVLGTFQATNFVVDSSAFETNNSLDGGTFKISKVGSHIQLDFTARPLTAIENWRLSNFSTSVNSGTAANTFDADADGVVNFLEYATGLNPNNPSEFSTYQLAPDTSGSGMVFTFNRIADPTLTYTVQGTDNLEVINWTTIWTGTGTAAGTITIPESLWPSDETHYFLRLSVSD